MRLGKQERGADPCNTDGPTLAFLQESSGYTESGAHPLLSLDAASLQRTERKFLLAPYLSGALPGFRGGIKD